MMLNSLIFQTTIAQKYLEAFKGYYTKIVFGGNITLGSDLIND